MNVPQSITKCVMKKKKERLGRTVILPRSWSQWTDKEGTQRPVYSKGLLCVDLYNLINYHFKHQVSGCSLRGGEYLSKSVSLAAVCPSLEWWGEGNVTQLALHRTPMSKPRPPSRVHTNDWMNSHMRKYVLTYRLQIIRKLSVGLNTASFFWRIAGLQMCAAELWAYWWPAGRLLNCQR